MKERLLFVLIIFANFMMLTNLYSLNIINENTGETFNSIMNAINDANTQDGDTLTILTTWFTSSSIYSYNIHTEKGITVSKNLTIQGQGADITIIQAHANENSATDRVFNIYSGKIVTLKNMTIKHGKSHDGSIGLHGVNAGGIYNSGTLNLVNIHLCNNRTGNGGDGYPDGGIGLIGGYGGGIYNAGTLTLTNSTVSNNITGSGGDGGSASVGSSNGGDGGLGGKGSGIYNVGTLTLTNSTISNNENGPGGDGGDGGVDSGNGGNGGNGGSGSGIYNAGTLTLTSSTIANNRTGDGGDFGSGFTPGLPGSPGYAGGVGLFGGSLSIKNTIIANNYEGSTGTTGDDYYYEDGTITDNGYNLVEITNTAAGANGFTNGTNNNIVGEQANLGLDSTLTYTGGFTQTLKVTSGVLTQSANYGSTTETTDQRGYYRKIGTLYSGDTPTLVTAGITRGAYQYYGVVARSNIDPNWTSSSNNYYTNIQGAENHVSVGNTIILAGTAIFESGITIDINLTISGEGSSNTYIQSAQTSGTASERIFYIFYSIVTLSDMTIRYGLPGIYNRGTLSLNNCTVSENTSSSGGGIYNNNGTIAITNCIITRNSITADYGKGGGIYSEGIFSNLSLSNVTISNNYSNELRSYGGGIYCSKSLSMEGGAISNNSVGTSGGGIYCSGGTLNLTNVIINDNTSSYINGGGIYLSGSSLSLTDVTISGNSTGSSGGGGILCSNSNMTLSNVTISGNTISSSSSINGGGGIKCSATGRNLSLNNVTISGNYGGYYGGGIYFTGMDYLPTITANDVAITGNSAINGGGIAFRDVTYGTLENINISDNSAVNGGGIYCCDNSSPILTDITIINNIISGGGYPSGGGIYCSSSSPSLANVTISGNSGGYHGGGIYCNNSNPSIMNSIFWDNLPQEIYIVSSSVNVSYSNIKGGWTGEGNINYNPLFLDPDNGDYHLSWVNYPIQDSTKSPCIDAGDPGSPLDPDSTVTDMGAYYYHQQQIPAYTNIKVFLEGPYNAAGDTMVCSLTLPTISPYDSEDIGSLPTVSGHSLVDWIQVKLRTTATGSTVDSCNAFLLEDGSVADVNGNSSLPFYNTSGNEYYIVIHHRNHLDIMSAVKHTFGSSQGETTNINLTTSGSIYGDGYQELETGIIGMYSGDINNDGEVTTSDYTSWYNDYITGSSGYKTTDLNMDGEVTTSDYTKWYNNFIVGASSSIPGQAKKSPGGSKTYILRKIEDNTKKIVRRKHEKQIKN